MKRVAVFIVGFILALALAPAALADWPHEVKWDQLERDVEDMSIRSMVGDTDWALTADDFPCTETGWITDIEFNGWIPASTVGIDSFRVTFWCDVPATADEASHPGDQPMATIDVGPADALGVGWQQLDTHTFKINLPEACWFPQERGTIYWIGIQGISAGDGAFYWGFRDRDATMWGDDAAYASAITDPWAHWGWEDTSTSDGPGLYLGTLPVDWEKSADMSFRLTGIPEPASLSLVAMGALALLFRRKR